MPPNHNRQPLISGCRNSSSSRRRPLALAQDAVAKLGRKLNELAYRWLAFNGAQQKPSGATVGNAGPAAGARQRAVVRRVERSSGGREPAERPRQQEACNGTDPAKRNTQPAACWQGQPRRGLSRGFADSQPESFTSSSKQHRPSATNRHQRPFAGASPSISHRARWRQYLCSKRRKRRGRRGADVVRASTATIPFGS